MNRNTVVVVAFFLLLGGFAAATAYFKQDRAATIAAAPALDPAALNRDGAMRMGPADAKVTIVEFFDPACETCAQFAPHLKALVDQNSGRVQIVERYAPFHPGSDKIVAILEASRKQDKYWETLDTMFSTQHLWADHHKPQPELLWTMLEKRGMDVTRLRTDQGDPAIAALIAEDLDDAAKLGVKATPEFFVNGKPLPEWGLKQLTELVHAELEAAY